MSFRSVITETIQQVSAEQNKTLAPLTDDLPLEETGLDSLCWAIIVARLEGNLGFDPFTEADDVYFPVTVGEFIKTYDNRGK